MPVDSLPAASGTYVLVMRLPRAMMITPGRLGPHGMPAGYYCYVGSAFGPGGLRARLRHHAAVAARPHWHVDYLRKHAPLLEIWYTGCVARREHDYASILGSLSGAVMPVPGFGASDCGCDSHLFHFPVRPELEGFEREVASFHENDLIVRVRVSG